MSSSNVYKKVGNKASSATGGSGVSNNNNNEIQKNEIRITAQGRSRNYISYAVGLLDPTLLQKEEKDVQTPSEPFDTVVLKAMGKAIQKAVTIAEVLKRRVAGLHQITSIESQEIEDQYEPKEEGMDVVTKKRTVSSIVIKLSKKALDTSDLGYQPPIPADQVTAPQIISTKKVPVGAGGEGAAAGKRRRRFRSGATRKQQQQQQTGGEATTTTTTATTTTATTRQPRQRNPETAQQQQQTGGTAQTSGAAQRGMSRPRGRGRGRGGRGGNRGGRGQPRNTANTVTTQSTGAQQ